SQVVSGYAVQNELLARHCDAWEVLRRPFHIDRRGGLRPGDEPTARAPVLGEDGHGLVLRYLRYWIEAGHEKAGLPLTPEQVGALLLIGWWVLTGPGPLQPEAHRLAGVLMLTLVWWVTEPIPIPATGLLAVALCVVLGAVPQEEQGRGGARAVLAPFADPSVF